jgi:hypothetical protein
VNGLKGIDSGRRPEPMQVEAILCLEIPQDGVMLSHAARQQPAGARSQYRHLFKGSISARTSRLVGSNLVEERAHLFDLPSNMFLGQAVIRPTTQSTPAMKRFQL